MNRAFFHGLKVVAQQKAEALLLDLFPGAAAAFSLRKLRSDYTGAAIRVRRSSDNAEQDFTATEITDGTLTTFCGAGDGFVSVWYNQGSGNDAVQNTASNQPKIVDDGVVVKDNGKPAIKFDGTNDFMSVSHSADLNFTADNELSISLVTNPKAQTNNFPRLLSKFGSINNRYNILVPTNPSAYTFAGSDNQVSFQDPVVYNGNLKIITAMLLDGAAKGFIDENQVINETVNLGFTTNTADLRIGDRVGLDRNYAGDISELIIWNQDKSGVYNSISNNINDHYAIY